ncbi:AmmeMemoRadiSam system protein B [Treponema pedis]|uniref:AmmeMemoRadiSam system protein B n=1 Tax=Treponema pedis str. T A4 TaxID=1291379 RepID=S5ZNQ3_9SPIR|nr:AmmeMemoRadiSam system protein B [Treponema pedis]AGT44227.1 hypothetical protein TPE_1753 [Treponema pedis str. T A4]
MKPFFQYLTFILIILFCFSCNKNTNKNSEENIPVFFTWEAEGIVPNKTNFVKPEKELPEGVFPWAGTVSHHLLADSLIDEWFSRLASARDIKIFYILSPSHWKLSVYDWALTDGKWKTKNGFVESSKEHTESLSKALDVPYDHRVFKYEHGVSVLIPYIKKYFPEAKVAALALWGEPPVNTVKTKKLAKVIAEHFNIQDKDSFLLISSDFSHKSNLKKTEEKDAKTRAFFENITSLHWTSCICDNRPSIYVLSTFITEKTQCTVQRKATSYDLDDTGNTEDITSYFFTFFWEKE